MLKYETLASPEATEVQRRWAEYELKGGLVKHLGLAREKEERPAQGDELSEEELKQYGAVETRLGEYKEFLVRGGYSLGENAKSVVENAPGNLGQNIRRMLAGGLTNEAIAGKVKEKYTDAQDGEIGGYISIVRYVNKISPKASDKEISTVFNLVGQVVKKGYFDMTNKELEQCLSVVLKIAYPTAPDKKIREYVRRYKTRIKKIKEEMEKINSLEEAASNG